MTNNQRTTIVRGLASSLLIINALGSLFASLLFWFGAAAGDPPIDEYEATRIATTHWQNLIVIFAVSLLISIVVNTLWSTGNKWVGYAIVMISLTNGILWAYSDLRFLWQRIEIVPLMLLFLLIPFLLDSTVIALTLHIQFKRKPASRLG